MTRYKYETHGHQSCVSARLSTLSTCTLHNRMHQPPNTATGAALIKDEPTEPAATSMYKAPPLPLNQPRPPLSTSHLALLSLRVIGLGSSCTSVAVSSTRRPQLFHRHTLTCSPHS